MDWSPGKACKKAEKTIVTKKYVVLDTAANETQTLERGSGEEREIERWVLTVKPRAIPAKSSEKASDQFPILRAQSGTTRPLWRLLRTCKLTKCYLTTYWSTTADPNSFLLAYTKLRILITSGETTSLYSGKISLRTIPEVFIYPNFGTENFIRKVTHSVGPLLFGGPWLSYHMN